MERHDNYRLQVEGAKKYFLRYDQEKLIEKLKLKSDEDWLYTEMLCRAYRIHRRTGTVERLEETWVETNHHGEVMTLLDLVCDSRPDRYITGRWKKMTSFSAVFHGGLLQTTSDPFAQAVQENQDGFRKACEALQGIPGPGGDISYALPVFDGMRIAIQFWEEDEDFPPTISWLWEENALMYLKYETMWFFLGLLQSRIRGLMNPEK